MSEPLKIEYRSVEALIPYARNSRTHDEAQVAQIAASIREFGWTNPVLVDGDSGIIAGHGRVLAARKLGLAEVPVIELAGISDVQRRAYVIADNKLALNGGWDDALLALELQELDDLGFDVDLTGFSAQEIEALTPEDDDAAGGAEKGAGSLAAKFMIPPFSVFNAREGWWQDRKRAWLALGIRSEIGRGGSAATPPPPADRDAEQGRDAELRRDGGPVGAVRQAAPGGSARPAADYSRRQRGNGAGKAL